MYPVNIRSKEDDAKLLMIQSRMGNRWSEIGKILNGRGENSVKNRYHSLVGRMSQSPPNVNSKYQIERKKKRSVLSRSSAAIGFSSTSSSISSSKSSTTSPVSKTATPLKRRHTFQQGQRKNRRSYRRPSNQQLMDMTHAFLSVELKKKVAEQKRRAQVESSSSSSSFSSSTFHQSSEFPPTPTAEDCDMKDETYETNETYEKNETNDTNETNDMEIVKNSHSNSIRLMTSNFLTDEQSKRSGVAGFYISSDVCIQLHQMKNVIQHKNKEIQHLRSRIRTLSGENGNGNDNHPSNDKSSSSSLSSSLFPLVDPTALEKDYNKEVPKKEDELEMHSIDMMKDVDVLNASYNTPSVSPTLEEFKKMPSTTVQSPHVSENNAERLYQPIKFANNSINSMPSKKRYLSPAEMLMSLSGH